MKQVGRSCALAALACTLIFVAAPRRVRAQNALEQKCATSSSFSNVQQYCNLVAQAVEIAQPLFGIAFAGGNPVAGTASTMGKSIVALPAFSVVLRATAPYVRLPAIGNSDSEIRFAPTTTNIDATIGVFNGFTLGPVVGGGLLAVDLLASAGIITASSGKGFTSGKATSYAAGIRVGILRESFVAPGISGSVMYRRMGRITFGDPQLATHDAYFTTDGFSSINTRVAISKRVLFVGATVGGGYDRFNSDASINARRGLLSTGLLTAPGFSSARAVTFANVSWTMLIVSAVVEVGWQSAGEVSTAAIPAGTMNRTGKSPLFGSVSFRVTL